MKGGQPNDKGKVTGFQGGELIKRGSSEVKEYIPDREIGYPIDREDVIRFAEGKQAESNVLDLLRGIPAIEYNTPDEVVREIERLESQHTREYIRSDDESNEQAFFQINSIKECYKTQRQCSEFAVKLQISSSL